MTVQTTPITLDDLTTATVEGSGVFDVLMRANKAHLEQEFKLNRIKGTDYANVYLGSLQAVLSAAMQFTLSREKQNLDSLLQVKQIELAQLNQVKLQAEIDQTYAQTSQISAETVNLGKQGLVMDKQALEIVAKTALTTQQKDNAAIENTVLVAQECKLRAEYDSILANTLRVASEKSLLDQKLATEKAQTMDGICGADSVLGKQKALYEGQAIGYKRDAEQKAAEIMFKSWATRKTTDDATEVNDTNKLSDPFIGTAIGKLLAGIGG